MPSQLFERVRKALAPEYVVDRQLATGGMGIVFLAREPALDRLVAIKVLRPELATAASVERFLREARLLAAANHPNIVPIHRVGTADGIAFFVMEYVEGATLADRIAKGRLPPVEVIRVGRDVLRAVSAAHALGIIHRDIKPSNIFLTAHGALLGDFGISKRDTEDSDITFPGAVLGTPGYMAPEQIAGAEATPTTDLYAVAMSLYEAATGRRWEHPAHVRDADWRGVPARIARVLQRGLELERERRWPTAAAFRTALRRARIAPYVRRTVLLAVAGLVVGIGVSRWVFVAHARGSAMQYDLAILPLTPTTNADTEVAADVSGLTRYYLGRGFPEGELSFVPPDQVSRWASRTSPDERTPQAALVALHANAVATGDIISRGNSLTVRLRIVRRDGVTDTVEKVVRARGDYDPLAYDLGWRLVRLVAPSKLYLYRRSALLQDRSSEAIRLWLHGEREWGREAWDLAGQAFDSALALDSTFAPAWWGLYNVQAWSRNRPAHIDLRRIYDRYGEGLNELERMLVRAELAPAGHARLATYDSAVSRFPQDANAYLLYGNELFTRGPLVGIALDSAVTVLEAAAVRDSLLGPVQSTLTWLFIRLGRRADAQRTLARYQWLADAETDTSGFSFPKMLMLAWKQRFERGNAGADLQGLMEQVGRDPAELADFIVHTLRWAPSLELLDSELEIGRWVASSPGLPDSLRLNAVEAMGVALVGLGRLDSAYRIFDSAAVIGRSPEYRLQAGQWRLIPAVLGVSGVPDPVRARGRRIVTAALDDTTVAARAAWTLGLDAYAHGDAAAAAQWRARLVESADSMAGRLVPLLDAFAAAARNDYADALTLTDSLGAFDAAARGGDPFVRSVLHLSRGRWLERVGRAAEAERFWRWYLNTDVVGYPEGPVQAAEIDWSFEGLGALRRADVLAQSDRARACRLYRAANARWGAATGVLAPLAHEVRRKMRTCP